MMNAHIPVHGDLTCVGIHCVFFGFSLCVLPVGSFSVFCSGEMCVRGMIRLESFEDLPDLRHRANLPAYLQIPF